MSFKGEGSAVAYRVVVEAVYTKLLYEVVLVAAQVDAVAEGAAVIEEGQ